MDAIFKGLTEPQTQAVKHIDGPMLILAGPGSGKTRVVTHRIANLLQHDIPPWQIAALTFTNKAADEMRLSVNLLAPNQPVWMGTFHRFCSQLLRRYAPMVGLGENYSIYDMSDAKQALKHAITLVGVSTSHTSPEKIAASISRAKNRLVAPEQMAENTTRVEDTLAAKVYPVYQQQLLTSNAVDFDDLLYHIARLLRENPDLRQELDGKFRYIMVDEYQDTNLAQYAIVRALSVNHPNLAVTGDPDQSIYGWRGADLNNILDFEKDYPNVTTVRLEQNYRSTPNILRVADQLIRHNRRRKQKELFTHNDEGDQVVMRMYSDGYEEADGIADEIATAIATENIRPSDVAIFCRMNALTRALEHSLRGRGIPYQIVNGVEFYQRKEIKDLLAYLHLINNPSHDVALTRVINTPTRAIGAKTVSRLREFADDNHITMLEAARHAGKINSLAKRSATAVAKFVKLYDEIALKATAPLEDILRTLVEKTEYDKFLEKTVVEGQDSSALGNVDELISAAVEFDRQNPEDRSLEAFLEQVALVSDTDAIDGETDRVMLMTMHAAKGLEFPYVYLIAFEEGILPHSRSVNELKQLEEERRLAFVGITRAKSELQISLAARRMQRGSMSYAVPSQFVGELPKDLMDVVMPSIQYEPEFEPVSHQARLKNSPAFSEFEEPDIDIHADNSVNSSSNAEPTENQDAGPALEEFEQELSESSDSQIEHEENDPLAQEELERAEQEKKAEQASVRAAIAAKITTASQLYSPKNNGPIEQTEVFQVGMLVSHPEQGAGKIASLSGSGKRRVASIEFFNGEQRKYTLAFSKLTPIRAEDS